MQAVEADIQDIEHEVFAPTRSNPAERIYALEREVLDLHRAIAPLSPAVDKLARGQRIRALRELESVFEDSVLPVSAATGEGLDELWKLIDRLASNRNNINPRSRKPLIPPKGTALRPPKK